MGRKIPGKKHRGIKDPYEQQARRFNKIKHLVDQKPTNPDDQELPKCLQKIAQFMEYGTYCCELPNCCNTNKQIMDDGFGDKTVRPKKEKNKVKLLDTSRFINLEDDQPGMTRPLKMIPRLTQHPNENDAQFLWRVEAVTRDMIDEAKYEDKYNVEIMRDENGNVISIEKRENIDPLVKIDPEQAEKKRQKRRDHDLKRKMKRLKRKKTNREDDFAYLKDNIEFGEVVHQPPKLDTQRLTKKIQIDKEKINLGGFLFMKTLKGENKSAVKDGNNNLKPSISRQRQLKEERKRVVSAYRELKKKKIHKMPEPY